LPSSRRARFGHKTIKSKLMGSGSPREFKPRRERASRGRPMLKPRAASRPEVGIITKYAKVTIPHTPHGRAYTHDGTVETFVDISFRDENFILRCAYGRTVSRTCAGCSLNLIKIRVI
jgi:hypothetical protein